MIEFFMGMIGVFLAAGAFIQSSLQARSEVISSLKAALRLTKAHIEKNSKVQIIDSKLIDLESEKVADAWSRVAKAIRPFDENLAKIFESKSDYWTNPEGFLREIQNGSRSYDDRMLLTNVENQLLKIEKEII